MATVIAIAGVSGAGKTTITERLYSRLKERSKKIHWDDYDDISTGPSDYLKWSAESGDHAAWNYPKLAEDLEELKSRSDLEYIFFDTGLGRLHEQTGKFIDFEVLLDPPMDVTLCRRALRDNAPLSMLEEYLNKLRPLFMTKKHQKTYDLRITSFKSPEEIVEKISIKLQNLRQL